jgi:hypothetical protein
VRRLSLLAAKLPFCEFLRIETRKVSQFLTTKIRSAHAVHFSLVAGAAGTVTEIQFHFKF